MRRRLLILGSAMALLLGTVLYLQPTDSPTEQIGSPTPEAAATQNPITDKATPSGETESDSPAGVVEQTEPVRQDVYDMLDGDYNTRIRTGDHSIALTFDDGPHPEWTPQVLDELREHGITATFCVIGQYAEEYPHLIQQIHEDGHTLCNHSWLHEMDLGEQSEDEIRANMERTNEAIRAAVPDADIPYFRHAGGNWTASAVSVSRAMDMEPIHWEVDPKDWDPEQEADDIGYDLRAQTRAGSIVLLHDGASNQEEMFPALREVLPEWIDEGYSFSHL